MIILQASNTGAFGIFYTQYDPLLSEILINKPPDAYLSSSHISLQQADTGAFFQERGTIDSRKRTGPLGRGVRLPLDFTAEGTFDEILSDARHVYLYSCSRPEVIRFISSGRHPLKGGEHIVVAEGDDRIFIAPEDDCILDVYRPVLRIRPARKSSLSASWGVSLRVNATIPEKPSTDDIFKCVSDLCRGPTERSAFRSHPFFRRLLGITTTSRTAPKGPKKNITSDIRFNLPPDLRFLYAASPLAFYLGAQIDQGSVPLLTIGGKTVTLPEASTDFEQLAGNMLSHVFQADCTLRYFASTGKHLLGADQKDYSCLSCDNYLTYSLSERLSTYLDEYASGRVQKTNKWHTASYIDPVPGSIRMLPSLIHAMSAIYSPKGRRVTEREVVQLEVRQFTGANCRSTAKDTCTEEGQIILPTLENAFVHQWLSDGYPIDAIKMLKKPVDCSITPYRAGNLPRIAIVCNENSMINEATVVSSTLQSQASVEIFRNLSVDEMLSVFSAGYDVVQYIGHSNDQGFNCHNGYADLSRIKENNTPIFFFNSCSSYPQGIKLLAKGSTCGISTLFKVIDEAAIDVCVNFYRLIALGYPVLTAYLGARQCSVLGKEYLLAGNGLISLFEDIDLMPLYMLEKTKSGYNLTCLIASSEKGFIYNSRDCTDFGVPDYGVILENVTPERLLKDQSLPYGACIYGSNLFDTVVDAALKAMTSDLDIQFRNLRGNKKER